MSFPDLPERVRRYTEGMPPGDWRDAVTDFGFVGDGVTDNAAAWVLFNEWCRAETLAGRTSMVLFPPTPGGKYVYDVSKGLGSFLGIRDLIFYAPGAVFQNTYSGPDRALRDAHWTNHTGVALWTDLGFGDPIDTMRPGSIAFTLKDPLRATGRLRVGDHVLVGSRDDQFYGYPPNIGQREFRRIASRHMTGGTLDAPVAYHHRDDFPDGDFRCRGGRARPIDCNPCQTEEFADGMRFRIVIDLTVAGTRRFRLAGTEMLGADAMTLGGKPIADLPAGRVMAARFTRTLSYAPAPGDPTIRVDMEWDRGTIRTLPV